MYDLLTMIHIDTFYPPQAFLIWYRLTVENLSFIRRASINRIALISSKPSLSFRTANPLERPKSERVNPVASMQQWVVLSLLITQAD